MSLNNTKSAGTLFLRFRDAKSLLADSTPYLPIEAGYTLNEDGMWHVAASTYMPSCSGKMIDWWFGYIQNTEQYKIWHPRDHVYSSWEGPLTNDSTYIGGSHLVHEYIGGQFCKLKISFCDPGVYFGATWREDFQQGVYSTAICARIGNWDDETGGVMYTGHLIHLVKEEPDGCRMRSRFWLGDIDGMEDAEKRIAAIPEWLPAGLCKHATEEMAILTTILPDLYRKLYKA